MNEKLVTTRAITEILLPVLMKQLKQNNSGNDSNNPILEEWTEAFVTCFRVLPADVLKDKVPISDQVPLCAYNN